MCNPQDKVCTNEPPQGYFSITLNLRGFDGIEDDVYLRIQRPRNPDDTSLGTEFIRFKRVGNVLTGYLFLDSSIGKIGDANVPSEYSQKVKKGDVLHLPIRYSRSYDVGNNFDSGDGLGTPATYIAQATGIYVFTICFAVGGASNYEMGIGLNTPILNYFHNCGKFSVSGAREIAQRSFTCNLNIGQTVTFPVVAGSSLAISNDARVLAGFGGNTQIVFASTNVTFIYGYRIG